MSNTDLTRTIREIKAKIAFPVLFAELYPDHYREHGKSLCPFHPDKNPSFELKADRGKCYAGCVPPGGKGKTFDDFSLWMVNRGCDFATAKKALAERAGIPITGNDDHHETTNHFRLEDATTVYDYHDADGQVVYKVGRFYAPDKTFRPFYPVQNGTWRLGLKGVKRVPFGLTELLATAPDEPVILGEGEKDILNARKLRFTAITTQGGAEGWNASVKDGAHEYLRNREVWLIPDCDDAGKHYADAATKTLHPIVRSLKIIALPANGKQGYDLSDFIDEHGEEARERLLELAAAAPEYQPTAEPNINEELEHSNKSEKKRPSKFDILVDILDETDIEFFHDQFRMPWASMGFDGHHENIRIRSRLFQEHLTRMFYQATRQGCGREILQQVQDLCAAKALFEGGCTPLSYRTAWEGENILVDLGVDDWRCVQISSEGWSVVYPQKPPFKRYSHMRALPDPVRGGDIQDLFSIIPVKDETCQALLAPWLPSVLVPDIPRASIMFNGLQGSGKTFAGEVLRDLVDPSVTTSLSLPKDVQELVQCLDHHYLPVFDNLSVLPKWASDTLCRASTGLGHTKRELYSNDEDWPTFVQRAYILNGISVCSNQPDLMDRVLLVELARIPDHERRPKKRLLAEYHKIRGAILGAMFDAIAYAMKHQGSCPNDELPRLADWAEWAIPIADAVGVGKDRFLSALSHNTRGRNDEINATDPCAVALVNLMESKDSWTGTGTELYTALSKIAEDEHLDRDRNWPKAPNACTRRIRTLAHNLHAAGIEIHETRTGHRRTRVITIRKHPERDREIPVASSDRPHHNDSDEIGAEAARPISEELGNTDHHTDHDYQQESLDMTDAGDMDDVSGYPAVFDPGACEPCGSFQMGWCREVTMKIAELTQCPQRANHAGIAG